MLAELDLDNVPLLLAQVLLGAGHEAQNEGLLRPCDLVGHLDHLHSKRLLTGEG